MKPIERPEHASVEWGGDRGACIVTCSVCGKKSTRTASDVARRIADGSFTGRCHRDRMIGRNTANRKHGDTPHPAVNWAAVRVGRTSKQRNMTVAVTCPTCATERFVYAGSVRKQLADLAFTGLCRRCSKGSSGTRRDAKGYVILPRGAVPRSDLYLFDAMGCGANGVREHRLVMARTLGRPLLTDELVDHMDGDKTNNAPSNLRIYHRGRNEPGSHNGHGTYYHEWQVALARIRELESRVSH